MPTEASSFTLPGAPDTLDYATNSCKHTCTSCTGEYKILGQVLCVKNLLSSRGCRRAVIFMQLWTGMLFSIEAVACFRARLKLSIHNTQGDGSATPWLASKLPPLPVLSIIVLQSSMSMLQMIGKKMG